MKKGKFKFVIIIGVILLIVVGILVTIFLMRPSKNIEVNTLNTIDLGSYSTVAEKIDLVKDNTVKIINKVDNGEIIGTGFFDADGYLITNSHVVDIKGDITVVYSDNTNQKAQLVSNDISSDIAILAVESPKVLSLVFGSTLDLNVTDDVYAIGYPLNIDGVATVTKGILSARRSVAGIEYLQTDASIDKGSSGGPLVNESGEVVGMNSLASNTSSIGMAISAETLQNIIYKLKYNKEVNYITDERPKNALSSVLSEVGYDIIDIYDEKEYLKNDDKKLDNKDDDRIENKNDVNKNEGYNNSDNVGNSSSETVAPVKSSDATLKSLSVSGYDIGFDDWHTDYRVTLKDNSNSVSISVVPNSSKAKYTVTGNDNFVEGENKITITVTAEDKTQKVYTITVLKPLTILEGATGVICGLDTVRNGVNSFHIFCDYVDSDRIRIYSSTPLNILNSVSIYVYAGWSEYPDNTVASDGKPIKLLKTYNFTPSINQTSFYIPINEIRSLLSEEDYEGGVYEGADLTFKTVLNTKKQGSFQFRNPWGLIK